MLRYMTYCEYLQQQEFFFLVRTLVEGFNTPEQQKSWWKHAANLEEFVISPKLNDILIDFMEIAPYLDNTEVDLDDDTRTAYEDDVWNLVRKASGLFDEETI